MSFDNSVRNQADSLNTAAGSSQAITPKANPRQSGFSSSNQTNYVTSIHTPKSGGLTSGSMSKTNILNYTASSTGNQMLSHRKSFRQTSNAGAQGMPQSSWGNSGSGQRTSYSKQRQNNQQSFTKNALVEPSELQSKYMHQNQRYLKINNLPG